MIARMMTVAILAAWLLASMKAWIPIAFHTNDFAWVVEAHYEQLAESIATFALDPDTRPLFPPSVTQARAKTALWLAAVPASETGYNVVWDGGGSLKLGDNDGGAAVGPWQTHWAGNPWKLTRDELAADRTREMELATLIMSGSIRACLHKDPSTWLTAYATGKYDCRENAKGAAHVKRALDRWRTHPLTETTP
jgi:hypothetical protein